MNQTQNPEVVGSDVSVNTPKFPFGLPISEVKEFNRKEKAKEVLFAIRKKLEFSDKENEFLSLKRNFIATEIILEYFESDLSMKDFAPAIKTIFSEMFSIVYFKSEHEHGPYTLTQLFSKEFAKVVKNEERTPINPADILFNMRYKECQVSYNNKERLLIDSIVKSVAIQETRFPDTLRDRFNEALMDAYNDIFNIIYYHPIELEQGKEILIDALNNRLIEHLRKQSMPIVA